MNRRAGRRCSRVVSRLLSPFPFLRSSPPSRAQRKVRALPPWPTRRLASLGHGLTMRLAPARRWLGLLLLACLPGLASPAMAQTLRWAAQNDALTLDPHVQNHAPTNAVIQHSYEGLTRYDRQYRIEAALATGWQQVSATEWRFQLRRDVSFHDGSSFSADDVLFSFERLRQSGSSMAVFLTGIKDIRKIDDYTVDFILERPVPMLARNIIDFRIMSRAWAQKNKTEKAQDLRNKEETYASRNANGTGPYLIRSWAPEQRIVFERNPGWWDQDIGNVQEVIFTPIRQDATRMAALLAGEVDLVTDPPAAEVARLAESPALKILDGSEVRTVFVGLDQGSDELKYSSITGRNPFKDLRVRKAMNLAVDAEAIRRTTMRGLSLPANILVAPGVNGWHADIDQRPPFDIEQARELLIEAGYPEGFDFTLDCPNNRFINDEDICEALAGMWSRLGLKVRVNAMPFSNLIPRIEKLDSSAWLLGWGAPTLDAQATLQSLVHTRASAGSDGNYNIGRISNPAIDERIDAAKVENDPLRREELLRSALQLTAENFYYVPLHHQVRPWAMKQSVTTVHKADDRPESRFASIVRD